MTHRPLYQIAAEISQDWKATAKNGIYFGAKPYLSAMASLTSIKENYGMDTAKSVVLYFLANAQTRKGEKAKAIKKELNAMCK